MSHHLAHALGAAASVLQLAAPMSGLSAVQGFGPRVDAASQYQLVVIHDRVTDSSRVTASLTGTSRPFGLGSRAWLDLAFGYVGRRLAIEPPFVVLTIESWTPARGGWAFAQPEPLHIQSGDSMRLEFPAAAYQRQRAHLRDSGRRELLRYDIPTAAFTRLAGASELMLRAGHARFRVRQRMEMLREVRRRMTPSARGPQ